LKFDIAQTVTYNTTYFGIRHPYISDTRTGIFVEGELEDAKKVADFLDANTSGHGFSVKNGGYKTEYYSAKVSAFAAAIEAFKARVYAIMQERVARINAMDEVYLVPASFPGINIHIRRNTISLTENVTNISADGYIKAILSLPSGQRDLYIQSYIRSNGSLLAKDFNWQLQRASGVSVNSDATARTILSNCNNIMTTLRNDMNALLILTAEEVAELSQGLP